MTPACRVSALRNRTSSNQDPQCRRQEFVGLVAGAGLGEALGSAFSEAFDEAFSRSCRGSHRLPAQGPCNGPVFADVVPFHGNELDHLTVAR